MDQVRQLGVEVKGVQLDTDNDCVDGIRCYAVSVTSGKPFAHGALLSAVQSISGVNRAEGL